LIDVAALQSTLDGRWVAMRDRAREVAAGTTLSRAFDLDRGAYREQVYEQLQRIADLGLPLVGMPESVGGANDAGGAMVLFEMLAYGDLSLTVKAGVQWGLFGGAILHLGNQSHHDRYLHDVASLALPGCFAMTETGHGSDVASIRTTATYDPDREEFVIDTPDRWAWKDYIGNAACHGRAAVVFAQLSTGGQGRGVHAFVVPIRDEAGAARPGVTIEDCGFKGGLNGVDNGRLAFSAVRVPRANLLDRYGQVDVDGSYRTEIENPSARFFTMLGTLIQGRVSVAGGAGSAAKLALAIALRYSERRRQFTAPGSDDEVVLLDYRVHQRKLLPLLAKSYALHFAQGALVEQAHAAFTDPTVDQRAKRTLESTAAGVKAVGTWHATRAIQTAREACGGAGYLAVNQLTGLKADTDVYTTFEGDNTVLLQLVAKELLTNYRTAFGELDTMGTIRFLTDQLVTTVVERTAARGFIQRLIDAAPGRDEDADLLDRGHQLELFAFREKHVLDGLAKRLRRVKPDGPDGFAGFNETQDHLLTAARAHVDRILLEVFVAGIERCRDRGAAALLAQVCDLFALSVIEEDRAWFLEHGRLTPRRAKAVTATVNALCGQLRPHALVLVEAFGIPEAAITAPIARAEC
jgi:acyl-CoA oxidase